MAVKSLDSSTQKRPNAYKLGVVFVKGFEIVVGDLDFFKLLSVVSHLAVALAVMRVRVIELD